MRLACDEAVIADGSVIGSVGPRVIRGGAVGVDQSMGKFRPVPIPGWVWWREFRIRLLPILLYLTVLGLAIWVWCNHWAVSTVW